MMKKEMIRFLAAGMAAVTITGATVAFGPVEKVFASEAASDASDGTTHEVKTIYANDVDTYIAKIVEDTPPSVICDNNRMYRIGNKVYSFTTFDHEPIQINKGFSCENDSKEYYKDCCTHGMIDREYIKYYEYYVVKGKIPMVNLAITTYTVNLPETIKITADKTLIRPGECAYLHFDVNEGADECSVTWRAIDTEGVADFWVSGNDAYLIGENTGTVMVFAETDQGVKDFIHISVLAN